MKVIGFLNKIFIDKKIPKVIRYDKSIWKYDKKRENYYSDNVTSINWEYIIFNCLNDDIEIIEDNKIEYLDLNGYHNLPAPVDDLAYKVNQIIEYINKESIR